MGNDFVDNFYGIILRNVVFCRYQKWVMNHTEKNGAVRSAGEIVVTLDYETIALPVGRNSINSIRTYLESIALAGRRILGELSVDGQLVDLSQPIGDLRFRRVDAVTIPLGGVPLLLLTTARQQTERVRAAVDNALTLVLINNPRTARELWWNVAGQLKEPVLTLSLMPEHLCELWCGTRFHKLRQWQLEQISQIMQRVDAACGTDDTMGLSDALENLVIPWLDRLQEHIQLWQDAARAGARLVEGAP
jgi:hypothetical protein